MIWGSPAAVMVGKPRGTTLKSARFHVLPRSKVTNAAITVKFTLVGLTAGLRTRTTHSQVDRHHLAIRALGLAFARRGEALCRDHDVVWVLRIDGNAQLRPPARRITGDVDLPGWGRGGRRCLSRSSGKDGRNDDTAEESEPGA